MTHDYRGYTIEIVHLAAPNEWRVTARRGAYEWTTVLRARPETADIAAHMWVDRNIEDWHYFAANEEPGRSHRTPGPR